MTWARSASGAPQHAIEQAEGWPTEVILSDRALAVSEATHEKHERQIERCIGVVKEFAGSLPLGYHMTAKASGGVNLAGSPEEWSITLRAYKPVPIVTARVVE